MAASSLLTEVNAECLADSLLDAKKKLDTADGQLVLDCSHVRRIDSRTLNSMLDLSAAAEPKKVRLILRGVNVDVYKVLKLMKLASRFSYVD